MIDPEIIGYMNQRRHSIALRLEVEVNPQTRTRNDASSSRFNLCENIADDFERDRKVYEETKRNLGAFGACRGDGHEGLTCTQLASYPKNWGLNTSNKEHHGRLRYTFVPMGSEEGLTMPASISNSRVEEISIDSLPMIDWDIEETVKRESARLEWVFGHRRTPRESRLHGPMQKYINLSPLKKIHSQWWREDQRAKMGSSGC